MIDLSYIIPPVDKALIKKELKRDIFLRRSNFGNNEIYVTTAEHSPNIMREIGRLREISFATEGGGTGKEVDIDEFDTAPEPYCFKQLFVWNPEFEEIVGGYRFIHGSNMLRKVDGTYFSPTAELFNFTEKFAENYLPYTVELGRSFVQPDFQPSNNLRKGMYSLDNLWDGLGTIAVEMPNTKYFFGKVTMYPDMNRIAKEYILYFYQKHFPDRDGLVWPFDAMEITQDYNELVKKFNGRNYKEDYQILVRSVRELGSAVPPLINAYMNLSSTMRTFGTAINHPFGDVDETGILVTVEDIYPEKKDRHLLSYNKRNRYFKRPLFFQIDWSKLKITEIGKRTRARRAKRNEKEE
ncbi:MAG: GNAT family N-acetyltransferase [Bacteroidales bacterium]|nr:GNAT family N-acetyltransferase [Bacteroidales bacterium]MBP5240307.1 GNAT family N-acetyltransferase [Bacteroidales bacterium]MBP5758957.1 GNAT family N-acetyltransferase [Bacteroidales bacterium]